MVKIIPRVANHIVGPRTEENGLRNYFNDGKNTLHQFGFKVESQESIAIHDIPLIYEFERFFTHLHLHISTKLKYTNTLQQIGN